MKKLLAALWLACVLFAGLSANAQQQNAQQQSEKLKRLNAPIPSAARELVKRATYLAERDKAQTSVAALRRAIALAPNYVNAHAEYIRVKAYFLNRYDEVRAEYENLMAKKPDNPVYPMALTLVPYQTPFAIRNAWYEKVVKLAPEWFWARYAKAMLVYNKEPEVATSELLKYLEADQTREEAFQTLAYLQEKPLKRIDDAIRTAEKMTAQTELRAEGLALLWRLRLRKAKASDEEKTKLRGELSRLAVESKDVKLLNVVRSAYENLLEDTEKAKFVKNKIVRLDPSWYPERGEIQFLWAVNASGIPRLVIAVNRQYSIYKRMNEIDGELEPEEKIKQFEKLFVLNPNPEMKRYLYERIFNFAEKAGETNAVIKYGKLLYAIDRNDAVILSKIGLALAGRQNTLPEAFKFARLADEATFLYRPVSRPPNNGLTDEQWQKETFTEERQRQRYKKSRSIILDTLGFVLCKAGNCAEGEKKLRESVSLNRSEQNLAHLAFALEKLGTNEEAEKYAAEAKMEYARELKQSFINEPAKDFELTTIDGRKVKLFELRGKTVLMEFWATWCVPCVKLVPVLNRLYEKYRAQGLEILYISTDNEADRPKVAPFVKEHKVAFPVLFDNKIQDLYNVSGLPTIIFIDGEGKIRYRDVGFGDESARKYETIITELLVGKTK